MGSSTVVRGKGQGVSKLCLGFHKLSQQDKCRIWESGKSRTGTKARDGQDSPIALLRLSSSPGRWKEEERRNCLLLVSLWATLKNGMDGH